MFDCIVGSEIFMSGAIVVPLTEMQQLAEQWRATITEMDAMVQHIARDIASIPDNGKGLNEVRSRGRTVGSHHQQLLVQGMTVQKQVVDSVQRFSQADHELAGMVRSVPVLKIVDVLHQMNMSGAGMSSPYSVNNGMLNIIDSLLGLGDYTSLVNDLGIKAVKDKLYPKLADFMATLNVWPTRKGLETSEILSTGLDIMSIGKDLYDSKMASSDADTALARGDYELASKKYNEAYDEALNMFATGTLAVIGIASGYGLVIAGTQVISGVPDWASNVAEKNGYHTTANVLKVLSEVTDLQSHTKKVWDVGFNAYQNPQAALQQTTNFVDHSANQVKDAAHNLYEGAVAKVNNLTNWAGGFISA